MIRNNTATIYIFYNYISYKKLQLDIPLGSAFRLFGGPALNCPGKELMPQPLPTTTTKITGMLRSTHLHHHFCTLEQASSELNLCAMDEGKIWKANSSCDWTLVQWLPTATFSKQPISWTSSSQQKSATVNRPKLPQSSEWKSITWGIAYRNLKQIMVSDQKVQNIWNFLMRWNTSPRYCPRRAAASMYEISSWNTSIIQIADSKCHLKCHPIAWKKDRLTMTYLSTCMQEADTIRKVFFRKASRSNTRDMKLPITKIHLSTVFIRFNTKTYSNILQPPTIPYPFHQSLPRQLAPLSAHHIMRALSQPK